MGFLKTLSNIGSAATSFSSVLGAATGVAGLLRGNDNRKQIQQQKELIDYQNAINQRNSLIDYNRQRELSKDNAMLQKIGLRQAGMNTSLGDGSVASAASVGGTSSTSSPSSLPSQSQIDSQYASMVDNASSSLTNVSLARSQQQLLNEQAENQRLRNITQLKRDIAEYTKLKNEAKNTADRNRYRNMLDEAESQYYSMNAKNRAWMLEDDTTMRDLQADMYADMLNAELESKRAYYQNLLDKHDLNNQEKALYEYKVRYLDSQIELNKAKTQDSLSHVGVNNATSRNLDSLTNLNEIEQYVKDASKEDAIRLAHLQVQEHGPQSISEDMWSIFNNWDNASVGQRIRAFAEITPSLLTDFWSGASHSAGAAFGKKVGPEQNSYNYHEYKNSKGEHSVYTQKKVKNYKPFRH